MLNVTPERRSTRIAKRLMPEEDELQFSRKKRSIEPAPDVPRKKVAVRPTQAITNKEEVIPLTDKDILRILSKDMPMDKASVIATIAGKSDIKNQQVPSIYSSYFFRKDILNDYLTKVKNKIAPEKLANSPLSQYNLYNKDDLLNNTCYRPDKLGNRYIEKTQNYSRESRANMKKIIELLASPKTKLEPNRPCSGIGEIYAKEAVMRAIDLVKNEDKFDILVASKRNLEDLSLPLENRIKEIVAFIIVELGECQKYPGSYSINLICTNKRAISGTGGILMGAFLYTILSHPPNKNTSVPINFPKGNSFLQVSSKKLSDGSIIEKASFRTNEPLVPVQQVAVLELASAYSNPGGLCMYEKFGFTYDQTMFSDNTKKPPIVCFNDRNNLPMLIDFNNKPGYKELTQEERKEKITDIAAGKIAGYPKSIICSIKPELRQKLLGIMKTIKLYIDNEKGASFDSFNGRPEEDFIKEFKNITQYLKTKNRQNKAKTGDLDKFINYIENNQATPDANMEAKITSLIKYLPPEEETQGGRRTRKNKRHSNNYSRKFH